MEKKDNTGWISLHRNILNTEIMKDSSVFHVFGYLLLRAAHKPKSESIGGIRINLKTGQVLVGSKSCPKRLKMGNKTWLRCLKVLKEYGTIKTEVIHGKGKKDLGTLVTIPKYTKYQRKEGGQTAHSTEKEVCQTDPLSVSNNRLDGIKQHTKPPLSVSNDLTNNKNKEINNKGVDSIRKETAGKIIPGIKLYKIDKEGELFIFKVISTGSTYSLTQARLSTHEDQLTFGASASLTISQRDGRLSRRSANELNNLLGTIEYGLAKIQYQRDKKILTPEQADKSYQYWSQMKETVEQLKSEQKTESHHPD